MIRPMVLFALLALSLPPSYADDAQANTVDVPGQILRTGVNLNSTTLSGNSQQLAEILGLKDTLQRLQSVRNLDQASGLEQMQLTQRALTILLAANFEVDFVLAEIDAEKNVTLEVLSTLTDRRDTIVNRSNQLSFATNGALWAICEGLAIPTWKRPKYAISSGIVGIAAGMVPSIASMYAMYKTGGDKKTSEAEANMLAKVFDYPIASEVDYPSTVWSFLNSVPASGTKTRRTQLIERWIADSNIRDFVGTKHSKELDVLTGSVSHKRGLSIERLNTRNVMLSQLGAEVFKMKRLLMELNMVLLGSKQV